MNSNTTLMSQDQLKALVGKAALDYVGQGEVIGVGTGSTVNHFIDALATIKQQIKGAVSSSQATTQRLKSHGIAVYDASAVSRLVVYIDGADEIDHQGFMIKGGGAALTHEKILAAMADQFVCIADASKRVEVLGKFALPVEVVPMSCSYLIQRFEDMGGKAVIRQKEGQNFVTDNGQLILDVSGLSIDQPFAFESQVSQWPGVLTVGVFAFQKANVCLLSSAKGIEKIIYS